MSKVIGKNAWHFRPLLTETLPYELPVLFGNDILYFSRCKKIEPDVGPLLERIFQPLKAHHTIPYNYSIRKDEDRFTTLSLVHPLIQFEFCELYRTFESSILAYCDRSEFSLRRPAAVAAVYVADNAEQGGDVHKSGQVHLHSDDAELELSRLVSYFAYRKYNLLNKFYESREFIRLEKRFAHLRQIDISKCFYSIYTHTLSWAVKSKEFAKSNIGAYAFDTLFDSLMQRANYRETNGIVVGPEFSRIFAEIILQTVDEHVRRRLLNEHELQDNVDYAVRRYVDDYSIFATEESHIEIIENAIRSELEKYKLYVNESKIRNFSRPFVTSLTESRVHIRNRLSVMRKVLASDGWKKAEVLSGDDRHAFTDIVQDLRVIVGAHKVQFGNISGSVMGELRTIIRAVNRTVDPKNENSLSHWLLAIRSVLDCALYLTAVDLRVRTTYSLCQLAMAVQLEKKHIPAEYFDQVDYLLSDELTVIAKNAAALAKKRGVDDFLELYNLLICGIYILGSRFATNGHIEKILDALLSSKITYFKYVTLKYCFLSDKVHFSSRLLILNSKVESMLLGEVDIRQSSELFHLMCDYFSAPDLAVGDRRKLYIKIFGGTPPNAAVDKLAAYVGFTDWTGMRVEHSLRRRQLRPVYAMA